MIHLLPISVSAIGGIWLAKRNMRRESSPRLIEQLAPPVQQTTDALPAQLPVEQWLFTTDQHLALSVGLLGMTAVSHLGLPLLHFLCTPGLIYLDFYFVRQAYHQWLQTGRISIETNDAVLVTGLLITGQLAAEALFAAFFFTSHKLQEKIVPRVSVEQEAVAREAEELEIAHALPTLPVDADMPRWQTWVDQGALPLLTLSAISTPFLGLHRSLSVLLANFGYDYRVLAPLSTFTYQKMAEANGIWLRDGQVIEQLQKIDILLINGEPDSEIGAMLNPPRDWADIMSIHYIVTEDIAIEEIETIAQISRWQVGGQRVAYLGPLLENDLLLTQVDFVIAWADMSTVHDEFAMQADVILQPSQPEQLHQLFALTTMLDLNRKRGLTLAFVPSIINLFGIYFWHFGPITALLVDYGGLGAGVMNAMQPQYVGQKQIPTELEQ